MRGEIMGVQEEFAHLLRNQLCEFWACERFKMDMLQILYRIVLELKPVLYELSLLLNVLHILKMKTIL